MIPIRNVYYMLCYAWENTLKQEDEALLDREAFNNIYNLLSPILIQEVTKLIKSGFARGYIDQRESLPLVRGKINLNNTLIFLPDKVIVIKGSKIGAISQENQNMT